MQGNMCTQMTKYPSYHFILESWYTARATPTSTSTFTSTELKKVDYQKSFTCSINDFKNGKNINKYPLIIFNRSAADIKQMTISIVNDMINSLPVPSHDIPTSRVTSYSQIVCRNNISNSKAVSSQEISTSPFVPSHWVDIPYMLGRLGVGHNPPLVYEPEPLIVNMMNNIEYSFNNIRPNLLTSDIAKSCRLYLDMNNKLVYNLS